jgi:Divergent InlB B-repeat domain
MRIAAVTALAACLFALGFLAVGALGRQGDSPAIVVDRSIGGVAIGMTQPEVEAILGEADSTPAVALRGGGAGLLARYRAHGGLLLVEYAGGHVVSVETTASFYRTSGGAGPGTSKAGLHGLRRDFCSLGLWDGTADTPPTGVVTVFQLAGDRIASVTIAELGYYDLCEGAQPDQELPDPRPSAVELKVQIDPDGGGYVRSDPYRIDCPTQCDTTFDRGSTVTLTATPTGGFTFLGWDGACTGTGPCVLTLDEGKSAVARFSGQYVPPPPPPPTTTTKPRE